VGISEVEMKVFIYVYICIGQKAQGENTILMRQALEYIHRCVCIIIHIHTF
jgi:hypothetical protein